MDIQTFSQLRGTTRRILRDNGLTPQFTDAQLADAIQYAQEQIALGTQKTRAYQDASFVLTSNGRVATVPSSVFKVIHIEIS